MEKIKKKITITFVVSVLMAIVYELLLKFAFKSEAIFLIDEILIDAMILFFIGLHFAVGFSKLYNFIISHRYKISSVLIILFTVLQYSGVILDESASTTLKFMQAFWWNVRWFALILVSFEFCKILTNRNEKIALCGAIAIAFSSVVQWKFTDYLVEIIVLGELLIVLLDKFLTEKKFSNKIVYSLGMSLCIILYAFIEHFSWMISFGYLFLALGIWIFIKNRNVYKISKKDVILILINFLLIIVNEYIYYVFAQNGNTNMLVVQNKKQNGISFLFSYLYNCLLPFKDIGDNVKLSNIFSVFPVPMIIAIYYIYKKEKHVSFLLPVVTVAVLETVFCISGFPELIGNITLFKYVALENAIVAVGFANFYILLYMIANIEEEVFSIKPSMRISIVFACLLVFVPLPKVISSRIYLSLVACALCLFTFLFLNNSDKRYRKAFLAVLVLFTLIGGLFVNPITKGGKIVKQIGIDQKNIQNLNEN